jgi:hypothetical protein
MLYASGFTKAVFIMAREESCPALDLPYDRRKKAAI